MSCFSTADLHPVTIIEGRAAKTAEVKNSDIKILREIVPTDIFAAIRV